MSELQQWIFRVDDLLNDYIEHDTTFECLPHDFQVIFTRSLSFERIDTRFPHNNHTSTL